MLLDRKLKLANIDPKTVTDVDKGNELSNLFFLSHDLIIAGRHYLSSAESNIDLASSGEMTQEEHYQYIRFTLKTMDDIFQKNPFVRYVTIFQNWLAPSGASIEHIDSQLVGLDSWGDSLEKKISLVRKNRNIFNELGANLAKYYNLIIAENEFALAWADIGHRFPTIAIYSKSGTPYPMKQNKDEITAMSNLLFACHKSMGSNVSCNEEWYYMPYEAIDAIPWHILLKWRINTTVGFEGGTNIFINPISPERLRDIMLSKLLFLKKKPY